MSAFFVPSVRAVGRLLASLVVAAGAPPSFGQQLQLLEPGSNLPPAALDQMLSLRGERGAVVYFPGALDRADHMLRRLEWVSHWIDRWSEAPIPAVVYVIDRGNWRALELPGTYGLPVRTAPTAIFAPAEGDAGTIAAWRQWLDWQQLPLSPGQPLVGTSDMAATLVLADVLLQIDLARIFADNAGLGGDRVWVGEAVAHGIALSLFSINEKTRLAEIGATFRRLREHLGQTERSPLAEFTPLLLSGDERSVRQWLWFQGVFHEAGQLLVDRYGKNLTKKLLSQTRANRNVLTSGVLLERDPALRAWLQAEFPEATPGEPRPR